MELPARFVRDYLDAARTLGVAPEGMLAGLAIDASKLDDLTARVRWNDFAELSDRIGAALGSNDRVEELGRIGVEITSFWAFRHLVPRVVSPALLFKIALQFTGPALFRTFTTSSTSARTAPSASPFPFRPPTAVARRSFALASAASARSRPSSATRPR